MTVKVLLLPAVITPVALLAMEVSVKWVVFPDVEIGFTVKSIFPLFVIVTVALDPVVVLAAVLPRLTAVVVISITGSVAIPVRGTLNVGVAGSLLPITTVLVSGVKDVVVAGSDVGL